MNSNNSSSQSGTNAPSNAPKSVNQGLWSQEQHALFLYGIEKYEKDWKKIAEIVGTRTPSQIRSHAQKYYNKRQYDQMKIGRNKQAIIGSENDQINTRSRLGVTRKTQKSRKSAQQRVDPQHDECKKESKKTKRIQKDKRKEKQPSNKGIKHQKKKDPQEFPLIPAPIYLSHYNVVDSQSEEEGLYGFRRNQIVNRSVFTSQQQFASEARQTSINLIRGTRPFSLSTFKTVQATTQDLQMHAQLHSNLIEEENTRKRRQQSQKIQDENQFNSRENNTQNISKNRKDRKKGLQVIVEQLDQSSAHYNETLLKPQKIDQEEANEDAHHNNYLSFFAEKIAPMLERGQINWHEFIDLPTKKYSS